MKLKKPKTYDKTVKLITNWFNKKVIAFTNISFA